MSQVQVAVDNYDFSRYVTKDRWSSYWQQIHMVSRASPRSVLIVGSGDLIVLNAIKGFCKYVKTVDIDKNLRPDFVGSVEDLSSFAGDGYDVVMCCQVLEHLPYEKFERCIRELKAVGKRVIISLPYRHWRILDLRIKVPRFSRMILTFLIPQFFKTYRFNGQHYWEVGTKGYSRKRIESDLKKVFDHVKRIPFKEYRYHLFFECE
jgi:hypothetical protein